MYLDCVSKVFMKKTQGGKVIRVKREVYLRAMSCGSVACTDCQNSKDFDESEEFPLEAEPSSISDLCLFPHYIIPDSNIIIHQIDVLGEPIFKNVILLQTVLQEVKYRRSPAYNKVLELLKNPERHFYKFRNEFHIDTYVAREPGESKNDFNDRGIREATKWYNKHLKNLNIKVVLLTNDKDNCMKAIADGITSYSFEEYVSSISEYPYLDYLLFDTTKLNNDGEEFIGKPEDIYPEYLNQSEIQAGLNSGELLQGTFLASWENYFEGYVQIGNNESDSNLVFIPQNNRAIHGDIVVIQKLTKKEFVSSYLIENFHRNFDGVANTLQIPDNHDTLGIIVGIIKRKWRPYCGSLQLPTIEETGGYYLFVPFESRIPKIRIQTKQGKALLSKRIIVSIDKWPENSRYPQGHYVQDLGEIGNKETELQLLLIEYDIPPQSFSKSVLDCLPSLPWIITDADIASRKDLRHFPICSVDPPGCNDINNAIHCRPLENGNLEVGVHVSDVSHFIRPGTTIDSEALKRGMTVHLVNKRIDMLPDLLSSNLCSLRENEQRFAFSVIWEMTKEAEILKTSYFKSLIKSKAALTYAAAQMRIDNHSLNDDVTTSLRLLNSLAKILKKKRIDNGALFFASTEVRFAMDIETHDPIDVEKEELKETNFMIEEFILLTNFSVAQEIFEKFPDCALLRKHPAPSLSDFQPLVKGGLSKGFEVKVDSNKALAESLEKAVVPENPYFNVMLRMIANRCMTKAFYFSSGVLPELDYYHYSLAVPIYTHFNSPIRRYADIIVHRLLAVAVGADIINPDVVNKKNIIDISRHLNYCHEQAQECGYASMNLYTHVFFKDNILEEEGYIYFIEDDALGILLPRFGLLCTLDLISFNGENDEVNFEYDESECSQYQYITINGIMLKKFDCVIVQVNIDRSKVLHEITVLKMVKPFIPEFSVPPLSEGEEPPSKKCKL